MRLRSELKLPHFSLIKVSIRKINDLLRSPQHFNVPVFPLKTTETSLDFNSWANWAPCLRISTGMNINHLCPTWNKIRIANDLWLFCDAVGEHWYSFYRMQTQHLRRDNPSPHLTNAHACRKGEYSLKSSMQWRQVVKPRYIALSRGARSHSLLLPSHPTQHLQGRSYCVGWQGTNLIWQQAKATQIWNWLPERRPVVSYPVSAEPCFHFWAKKMPSSTFSIKDCVLTHFKADRWRL